MNEGFTDRARSEITGVWTKYSSMDLLQGGAVVIEDVPFELGAAVDGNQTQHVRRTFSGSLANPAAFLPLLPSGLMSPFLTEIRVWDGVRYSDGTFDRWAIFTGAIEDPQVDIDDGVASFSVQASDRAQDISDRRLPNAVLISSGTSKIAGIKQLIDTVRSGIQYRITDLPGNPTLPEMQIDELEDPWDHAQQIAESAGAELFFDGYGTCVIRPVLDPNDQPIVWSFAPGELSMALKTGQQLSAKDSYSHAIVVGSSIDGSPPIRSDKYDSDPQSPTYFEPGVATPFGDKPIKLSTDLITTQDQADSAAVALVNRKKGAVSNLSMTIAPITALDEGDAIAVTNDLLQLDSVSLIIEGFHAPCDETGVMELTTRSRRL